MPQDTFLVTVPPQHLRTLQAWDVIPAHLAYRVGRGPHLFRSGGSTVPKGGRMVLDHQGFDGQGAIGPLCQEIIRECQVRGFSGVILDFDSRLPPLEKLSSQLDESFRSRGWSLYVPEVYAPFAPRARVMIPSALSGGSLAHRLEEACGRFGRERVVVALDMVAEDFRLPSPTGCGTPLSREELQQRMERLRPSVFFSPELCARYFTYMSRDSGAHFVLFDDGDTLRRKVEVARQAGIHTFLLPWALLEAHASSLGIPRLPSKPQKGRT